MLTGLEIAERLGTDIIIKPFDIKQLNPNSYDLRLHNELMVYLNSPLDMKKDNETKRITITEKGYLLQPGVLYLARTVEFTETYNLAPQLDGRSSIGRLGLSVHITAGFGDIGFKGFWTLELSCIQPVLIYPLIRICQIYYHQVSSNHHSYISNKYQNNRGIQSSKMFLDFIPSF